MSFGMDSSCSEAGDGSARLSLSLVSYGSADEDEESITSASNHASDTVVSGSHDWTQKVWSVPASSISEEDNLVLSVAEQLGLSGISLNQINHLARSVEKMEASQQRYLRYKLILDAVFDAATSSKLPLQTAQKVKQALENINLLDYVTPTQLDSADGVFGVSSMDVAEHLPIKLTPMDTKLLRDLIEEELALKHQKLIQLNQRSADILAKVSGPAVNVAGSHVEGNTTHEIMNLLQVLDKETSINKTYVESLDKILSDLVKLKLENFDQLNGNKVNLCGAQCEVLKKEMKSLNDQVVNGIYLEDPHLIDAHSLLKRNLDLAVTEAKLKLSELKKKDAEYEKLRGTRFDGLVQEYQGLLNQIAQKEFALKNLL